MLRIQPLPAVERSNIETWLWAVVIVRFYGTTTELPASLFAIKYQRLNATVAPRFQRPVHTSPSEKPSHLLLIGFRATAVSEERAIEIAEQIANKGADISEPVGYPPHRRRNGGIFPAVQVLSSEGLFFIPTTLAKHLSAQCQSSELSR